MLQESVTDHDAVQVLLFLAAPSFLCMWSSIEKFNAGDLGPASIFTGYVIPPVGTSFPFGNRKRDVVTLAPHIWVVRGLR